MLRRLAPLLLLAALAGCDLFAPSRGECHGRLGTLAVDGAIDGDESFYFKSAAGEVTVELSYVSGTLYASGSMPSEERTWALPADPAQLSWNLRGGGAERTSAVRSGQLRLTDTSSTRLAGEFETVDADGARLTCTFDLRHDYGRDYDAGDDDHDDDWDD